MATHPRTATLEPWVTFAARNFVRFAAVHAAWALATTLAAAGLHLGVVDWTGFADATFGVWFVSGYLILLPGFPLYLAVLLEIDRWVRRPPRGLVRWLIPILDWPLVLLAVVSVADDGGMFWLACVAALTVGFAVVASPRRRHPVPTTA